MNLKGILTGAVLGTAVATSANADYSNLSGKAVEAINQFNNTGEVGKDQAQCAIAAIRAEASTLPLEKALEGTLENPRFMDDVRNACAERTGYKRILEGMSPTI